jgi:hypothetical protein
VLGVLQAIVLAAAAWFAWRTYRAAQVERVRAPRRRLIEDAISELKRLAETVETYSSEMASPSSTQPIRAAQRRLALALASTTWVPTHEAVEAAYVEPRELDWDKLQGAMADLGYAMRLLERDKAGFGEYPDEWLGEDRPPLAPPPKNLRDRWRRSIWHWRFRRLLAWPKSWPRRPGAE